jgi:quercetin dioxygenase-like cupin family protein
MQLLEAAPHTLIARHTHPGVETSYILEGELELTVEGKGTVKLTAGDKVGASPAKLILTYVVEKAKPLASPAP